MFPIHRGRRLRVNESIRSLVRETSLSPADFMFPMFIMEGENTKVEIPSMPGIFRRTFRFNGGRSKRSICTRHSCG